MNEKAKPPKPAKAADPLVEIEKTQAELKATIEESERLIDKTQGLLKKHRDQIERKKG